MDNQNEQTNTPTWRDVPSSAIASAEEIMSHPPELQGTQQKGWKGCGKRAADEEEDASLDEEMRPGAVAMAGVFTGPTSPSILSEP
jgi:hypothetical protein